MQHRSLIAGIALVLLLAAMASAARPPSADVSAALNVSALRQGESAALAVVVDIHNGLHAQSHTPLDTNAVKLEVTPDANPALEFGDAFYPAGETKQYAKLGTLNVYTGRVIFYVPVRIKSDAPLGPVQLGGQVTLQACNDNTCFFPEHATFKVDSTIVAPGAAVTPKDAELFAGASAAILNGGGTTRPAAATQPASSTAAPTVSSGETTLSFLGHSIDLSKEGFGLVLAFAFLAGIIFNIVPCVLPVLPLKAIGFYEASQHNRSRTLLLGFVFSLGLIAVFAALGLLILLSKSLFGSQISWGQWFSHPSLVWIVAIVLALLGLGMFGVFSVNLPTSVYGLDFRHDTISGNFMWGALTAVLSTPCTAPLFPPVLGYALTKPPFVGFFVVVMVGAGMASPYFLLSAFPELARRFPRTGALSELVKQMMGFLLLGSAAFFAGTELLAEPNQWWLVFAVVVWGCLYLVIRTPQITKSAGALYVSTALAVLIGGGALIVVLRLTDAIAPRSATAMEVQWQPYSPQALADSRKQNKIVLIDFTANWCLNCKYVETTVYRDPRTVDALKKLGVVMLKADLTNSDAPGFPLLNELGANGIPYTAVYLPGAGKPVGLASIYTTDTLLGVIAPDVANPAVAAVK